uniref:Phenoloxidase-activating factor 2 n=1 Tax=Corethrella appendiculata TaxID=1370023 RepID=U5EPX0_9DIPT
MFSIIARKKFLIWLFVIGIGCGVTSNDIDFEIEAFFEQYFNKSSTETAITTTTESTTFKNPNCNGECVPFHLCSNNTTITDGSGLIDIRFDEESECENYLDFCCEKNDVLPKPKVQEKSTFKFESCGVSNPNGVGFRITGNKDNETEFGEFPFVVAILKEQVLNDDTTVLIFECGGTLIAPNVVITAAHCVIDKDYSLMAVRAGEWDVVIDSEPLPHVDQKISEIIIHENYYKGTLFNDIAIVIVETEFNLAEHIQPICLPPFRSNFDQSECFGTGWGKDKFGKIGQYQTILKKIDLPIVSRVNCQNSLRKTRLGRRFRLHDSFMCAGGKPGIDTCSGDGGGPLLCPIPGGRHQYYFAGIVSWGIGCGNAGIPGVYVNVAQFTNWIDQKLRNRNVDSKYYLL